MKVKFAIMISIKLITIFILILSTNLIEANCRRSKSMSYKRQLQLAMQQNGIVPDVIDSVPPNAIEILYPSGVKVNMGNELTPTEVKDIPVVKWPIESNALYTLAMVDPDAPSRLNPTYGPIKHWIVVNIPGLNISKGETLAEYIGSGAPKGTGLHRYVFLVYRQKERLRHSEIPVSNRSRTGRTLFKIRDFATKYDLNEPIAANFFQAQYDDYVPKLQAQLQE